MILEMGVPAAASKAAEWLLSHGVGKPRLAVILGSGLSGALRPAQAALEVDFEEIPGFIGPSVSGHPGRLLAGALHGLDVIFLEGRTHLYEGLGSDSVRLPSAVLAAMGVKLMLLTSACGGLNSNLRVGDFVVVRDHLVYPFGGPAASLGRPSGRDSRRETGAARGLKDAAAGAGRDEGRAAVQRGLYSGKLSKALEKACMSCRARWMRGILALAAGPCYEGAAEARLLRMAGADVVSMSAAADARAAAGVGLEVACLCSVTNVIGLWKPLRADHRDVIEAAQDSRETLGATLDEFVRIVARGGWLIK